MPAEFISLNVTLLPKMVCAKKTEIFFVIRDEYASQNYLLDSFGNFLYPFRWV